MKPDEPTTNQSKGDTGHDEAVELIRQKVANLYGQEPTAKAELEEIKAAQKHLSKHQQFMLDLSSSGKSLADIQTAWHNYYQELPDKEKHEVWQEFYANHAKAAELAGRHFQPPVEKPETKPVANKPKPTTRKTRKPDMRNVAEVKQQLLNKVGLRANKKRSPHHQSLLFGLAMGTIVTGIMLFGFFNERFVAPFITPSKTVTSTPLITDNNTAIGPEPKIIIPKINVEFPVVYDEPSIDEGAVQKALERGVLHYATTSNPGELGNTVIFGHSSNNILNRGKYKFAFVLLKRLEIGDTFMLQKDSKRYIYKVYDKKVVKPEEVDVLGTMPDRTATATLITCDPPGTSLNRLVVIGEQISPDPTGNVASSVKSEGEAPTILPSNAPSLWHRLIGWLSG